MSSTVARTAFRAEMASAFSTLPQYDTLGVRLDNNALEDLWATTEFVPIEDRAIAIGSPTCMRETGTFRAIVVGKTGAGDSAVVAQADALVEHFRRWVDSTGEVRVVGNVPPAPSDQSDGRWLVVSVDFSFARTYYA